MTARGRCTRMMGGRSSISVVVVVLQLVRSFSLLHGSGRIVVAAAITRGGYGLPGIIGLAAAFGQ